MTEREGVDVASFQGAPGQWTGHAGDIGWAGVKVTELSNGETGRYVNPDAAADVAWLKQHGKGRLFYLFGHPDTSAAETASFFITEVKRLGLEDGDAVALDLEVSDGKTPAEVDDWALSVVGVLQHDLGRVPVVYTFLDFAEAGNCSSLGSHPLWIADPSSKAGSPRVPHPWKTWAIHQYSITGNIDRDLIRYATVAEMRTDLGKRAAVHKAAKPKKPKKHVVKKTAVKAKTAVKKATSSTKKTLKKEPVVATAGTAGGLSAAVTLLAAKIGVHLTVTQIAAILTALPALATLIAAVRTTPAAVTAATGALSTIGTAAVTFGLHLPATLVGAEMPAASLVVALLLRMHVSPKMLVADFEQAAQVASDVQAVVPAGPASAPPPAGPLPTATPQAVASPPPVAIPAVAAVVRQQVPAAVSGVPPAGR